MEPEKLGLYINNLWAAFTLMESKADMRLLFKDLFTHTEYKMFAKRLEIARRLLSKQGYEIIQREMQVTPGTVSHINNILSEKGDGFRKAHSKLEIVERQRRDKEREHEQDLANPFRVKVRQHNKTVVGEVLKVGLKVLDRNISKKLKQRTVGKSLEI
jgi:uncharacterized protein YerC